MNRQTGETRLARTPPYAPSWVDRLQGWLVARQAPVWSIYLSAWLITWALVSGPVLLRGTSIPPFALRVHASFSANVVLFLGAMHYLDGVAQRAIQAFCPAMEADEQSSAYLRYAITTLPARPVLLVSLFAGALPLVLSPVSIPAMAQFYLATSPLAIAINVGLVSTLGSATFGVFLFHTIRQLRVVSQIHRQHTQVSLFRLQALYGLSSLTARTAFALVIVGAIAYATRGPAPATLSSSTVWPDPVTVGVGYLILSVSMAAAVFASPLIGLHRMLMEEKSLLQAENDRRLERALGQLHRLVDEEDLEQIDALNKAISSLVTERDVIRKTPTWPWSPGALGVLTSAVVLPIVVWLLQNLLDRILLP